MNSNGAFYPCAQSKNTYFDKVKANNPIASEWDHIFGEHYGRQYEINNQYLYPSKRVTNRILDDIPIPNFQRRDPILVA